MKSSRSRKFLVYSTLYVVITQMVYSIFKSFVISKSLVVVHSKEVC